MKLFIAEKPSLARAIVDVLPKPHKKNDGYIEAGNGDVVTWCIGHLLEQAPPEDYDIKYKKWVVEHLPIIPEQWKLKPKPKTRKQLTVIKRLIKQADTIVNSGDVDREGQILVDEAISFSGASKSKIDNALRCLITDMNFNAVKKAVDNLKPNKNYIPLAVSALSRARADWLYGLNMTRLCTLQGQKSGYQGVLSIGRVQTPILGLVVNRDIEIENFISKPFYEVLAHITTKNGEKYQGKWKPSKACEPFMDEEKRILSKKLAENVVNRINDKPAKIEKITQDKKQQVAPLPFSLSGLQISAAKAFGMSAKQVLDICQQLYEKHKLITYPRSDCQYLPTEHLNDVPAVTNAMSNVSEKLADMLKNADLKIRSRAWNNKKVSAHHAIIPTAKNTPTGALSNDEAKIYEIISRQYIAQFYPNFEYMDKQIDTIIDGGLFISKQKDIIKNGWKDLFPSSNKSKDNSEFSAIKLPNVIAGDCVHCLHGELVEKNTSPPKYFTDATILGALTGIARYVTNAEIKKLLRDTDGLGTEATRAGIIELLFKRQFLVRKGKDIRATEIGKKLITSLPVQISQPDMTALWESQLESISNKTLNYQFFIKGVEKNLQQLILEVKDIAFTDLPQSNTPRRFTKKRNRKRAT
ncbi:DNA topoisomerase III [Colwellia sp. BRX10-6]|uniref:DNA topoisomerase III n=1 Tax=unclassified Colwellia TaxID=196834 RepID=UPI0015F5A32E|nr:MULTISPECIES: DNA topoisomerase III [unclassified Colwellia]MBA6382546.1 DNA topoisomerase III [Colwellia sp. BRX10-9]MBA6393254.1 DNA topoisomerase III [Colwellia sp. BRX10-6]